jgi:site-specific DNA-methyltransferase (adenine-specific)
MTNKPPIAGSSNDKKRARLFKLDNCVGRLFQLDALEFLKSLPGESADVLFLDPPFNLNKAYSARSPKLDSKTPEEYEQWLSRIAAESIRVLAPGGTLFAYHIPIWAFRLATQFSSDLKFLHWIAVSMKNGFPRGRKLYPAHYALLMFSKGPAKHFSRPKVQLSLCRHCKKSIKDYGGYRGIIERNGGVNLSDFWDDLSPVRHANRKHRSQNELPTKLFERIFLISGVEGGVYVDPFAGAGSGVIQAPSNGMNFQACDIVKDNCTIIADRLQTLKKASKKNGAR